LNALTPLRDVSSVEGSFVFDERSGQVLLTDLNAFFRPDMLVQTGRRLVNLLQVIDDNFDTSEEVVATFDRYSVVARRMSGLMLVVLLGDKSQVGMLRLAAGPVLRSVERELTEEQPVPRFSPPQQQSLPSTPRSLTPMQAPRTPTNPQLQRTSTNPNLPRVPTNPSAPRTLTPMQNKTALGSPIKPPKKGGGIWD
jgi:hypothetical protein